MSLINQMLQDLEKRKADGTPVKPDHPQYVHYRAVPAPRSPYLWMVSLVILLAALIGYFLYRQKDIPVNAQQTAVAVTAKQSNGDAIPQLSQLPLLLKMSTDMSAPTVAKRLEVVADSEQKSQNGPSLVSLLPSQTQPITQVKAADEGGDTKPSKMPLPEKNKILSAAADDPPVRQDVRANPMVERSLENTPIMVKEVSPSQRAESEFKQATVFHQQGRNPEAIQALQRALELDQMHMPARQMLVNLMLDAKRYDDAARELKAGLALDQHQVNFAMVLARILVERAKVTEAIDVLQKSAAYAQDRPDYVAFLAALQQKLNRHKEAIMSYRAALSKHSQNGVWWMGLGISLQAEGHHQDALEAFRQAKVQPGLGSDLLAFVDQRIAQLQK